MKRLSAHQYAEGYANAMTAVVANQRHDVTKRFVDLIRRHRAQRLWPAILTHLQALDDAAAGRTRITVTSARAVDERSLTAKLEKVIGPIILDQRQDSNLIGGLTVRIGDDVIDGSVAAGLQRLRTHLLQHAN